MMDTVDIARVHRADAFLLRACAEFNDADAPSLTAELMYHLEMMLRVVTKIGIMSGELANFAVAPASARRVLETLIRHYEDDGQRTVTTTESESACQ
jgi:hypothetical protein